MDRLKQIFDRQREYMRSLAPIYGRNGFAIHNAWPYSINSRADQEQLRLLAWRITEEIYEALDLGESLNVEAFREEIADALHFLVELAIVSDMDELSILAFSPGQRHSDLLSEAFSGVGYPRTEGAVAWMVMIEELARTMMLLKQRPWRTDNRPTDRAVWESGMRCVFARFIAACRVSGITAEDLYRAYFRKAEINDERTKAQSLVEEPEAGYFDDEGPHP